MSDRQHDIISKLNWEDYSYIADRVIGSLRKKGYLQWRYHHSVDDLHNIALMGVYKFIERYNSGKIGEITCIESVTYWWAYRSVTTELQKKCRFIPYAPEWLYNEPARINEISKLHDIMYVDEILDSIEDESRDLLHMRFYKDMTYPEIAKKLGWTVSQAQYRVNSAIEKCQESLGFRKPKKRHIPQHKREKIIDEEGIPRHYMDGELVEKSSGYDSKEDLLIIYDMRKNKKMSFREIGEALGISPECARDRVDLAYEVMGEVRKKKVPPSKKELERILFLKEAKGYTHMQIAKELGIGYGTVQRRLLKAYKACGLGVKKAYDRNKNSSEDDLKKMLEMKDDGLSIKEIAKEYGISYRTARRRLKKAIELIDKSK